MILVGGRGDEGEFDGGAEVEDERDDLVDRAGLEFGQTVVVGGARGLFDVVLDGEHHRFEEDTERADDENDGGKPAVFAEEAVEQRLQGAGGVRGREGRGIGGACGDGGEDEERDDRAALESRTRDEGRGRIRGPAAAPTLAKGQSSLAELRADD